MRERPAGPRALPPPAQPLPTGKKVGDALVGALLRSLSLAHGRRRHRRRYREMAEAPAGDDRSALPVVTSSERGQLQYACAAPAGRNGLRGERVEGNRADRGTGLRVIRGERRREGGGGQMLEHAGVGRCGAADVACPPQQSLLV